MRSGERRRARGQRLLAALAACALLPLGAAAQDAPPIPQDVGAHLASAQSAIAEKRYEDARAAIDAALGVRLLSPRELGVAFYLRGQASYELGDVEAATADWGRALEAGELAANERAALEAALAQLQEHMTAQEQAAGPDRAVSLIRDAAEAMQAGRWDDAAEMYERALPIFEREGDQSGLGMALWGLGGVRMMEGDLDESISLLDRAKDALMAANASRTTLAGVLAARAQALGQRVAGDGESLEEAKEASLLALSYFDESSPDVHRIRLIAQLGFLAHLSGDLDEAESSYMRAYELFQTVRPVEGEALLVVLALVARERGDAAAADAYLERFIDGKRAAGMPDHGARQIEMAAAAERLRKSGSSNDRACWLDGRARALYEALGQTEDAEELGLLMKDAGCPDAE